MNGIPIEGGVNDCYHNMNGFCVCPYMHWNKGRDRWLSRVRCVATQFGVVKCHGYVQSGRVSWYVHEIRE
jgi:hypothetical protein